MWASNLRRLHDGADDVPALCPTPAPQPHRLAPIPALVCRADVMNKIQHVEKRRRNRDWRYIPVCRFLALFDYDGAVFQVDTIGRQGQRL